MGSMYLWAQHKGVHTTTYCREREREYRVFYFLKKRGGKHNLSAQGYCANASVLQLAGGGSWWELMASEQPTTYDRRHQPDLCAVHGRGIAGRLNHSFSKFRKRGTKGVDCAVQCPSWPTLRRSSDAQCIPRLVRSCIVEQNTRSHSDRVFQRDNFGTDLLLTDLSEIVYFDPKYTFLFKSGILLQNTRSHGDRVFWMRIWPFAQPEPSICETIVIVWRRPR